MSLAVAGSSPLSPGSLSGASSVLSRLQALSGRAMKLSKLARSHNQECELLASHVIELVAAIDSASLSAVTPVQLDLKLTPLIEPLDEVANFLQKQVSASGIVSALRSSSIDKDFKRLHERVRDAAAGVKLSLLHAVRDWKQSLGEDEDRDIRSSLRGLSLRSDPPVFHLPASPRIFHGREAELGALVQALLLDAPAHLAILGPGGIGKTTLVASALNDARVARKFDKRRLFHSCDGVDSTDGIMSGLAQMMGLIDHGDQRTSVVNTLLLLPKPAILVLDNLESAWDTEDQSNVESILAEFANIADLSLLITLRGTRRPSGVDWTLPVTEPLQPVSIDAARDIYISISHRSSSHTSELDRLLELMEGLPLAITLMANLGQVQSVESLLADYEKEHGRMLTRGRGRRLTCLETSIRVSLNSLTMQENPDASTLLSILCLLPDGMTVDALKAAIWVLQSPRQAAQILQQVALAAESGSGRLKVLAPIREFVLEELPPSEPTLSEVRYYFMTLAEELRNVGWEESKQTVDWILADFGNIHSILRHWWREPPNDLVVYGVLWASLQLADFSVLASVGDCGKLMDEARNVLVTREELLGAANCTYHHGRIYAGQNRWSNATSAFQDATSQFEALKSNLGIARCMQGIGEILRQQNKYEDAIRILEKANTEFQAIDHPQHAAQCTETIGNLLYLLQRYDEALEKLEDAKAQYAKLEDRLGQAQCIRSMADALRFRSRNQEALAGLEDARARFDAIGDRMGSAYCVQLMGDVLHMMDDNKAAFDKLETAKTSFKSMGHRRGMAQCMQTMGEVLHTLDRYDDAIASFEEGRAECEAIGDREGRAQCTRGIGVVLRLVNRCEESIKKLETAQAEFEAIGNRLGVVQCTHSIGDTLYSMRRPDNAISCFESALDGYRSIGNELGAVQCIRGIGIALSSLNRNEEALQALQEAKLAFNGIGDRLGVVECTQSIGAVLRRLGRYYGALSQLGEAKKAFVEMGNRLGAAQCTLGMGEVFFVQNLYQDALGYFQEARSMLKEIGVPALEAQCAQRLGNTLKILRRFDEAAASLEEARPYFKGVGNTRDWIECTRGMGESYRSLGRLEDAITKLAEALEEADAIGENLPAAHCAYGVAYMRFSMGQYDVARVKAEQAKSHYAEADNVSGTAECARLLGYIANSQERSQDAIDLLEEALRLFLQAGRLQDAQACEAALTAMGVTSS